MIKQSFLIQYSRDKKKRYNSIQNKNIFLVTMKYEYDQIETLSLANIRYKVKYKDFRLQELQVPWSVTTN